jgi:Thiamine pyrophosphate enzyme, N-terminal TPP binding domain
MKNDSAIMDYRAHPRFSKNSDASSPDCFPPKMPLAQFLFEYLYRRGVRYSFGLPGDFALTTFAQLEKSKIQSITMTHEPAAGFAADAYARFSASGWSAFANHCAMFKRAGMAIA